MKSNLKKLTNKLKKLKNNCGIPIKSLNELNQVAIALHRAGFHCDVGEDTTKECNHITEAKYFCYDSFDNTQKHPIGLSVYQHHIDDKSYMVVNWDVVEDRQYDKILKL